MAAITSSAPSLLIDAFASGMPRVFVAATTAVSSAIAATGFWAGAGDGSRGFSPSGTPLQPGMRIGDVLMHISSTNSATPGRCSTHSVLASTANVASTSLSSGFNASFDVTVSLST